MNSTQVSPNWLRLCSMGFSVCLSVVLASCAAQRNADINERIEKAVSKATELVDKTGQAESKPQRVKGPYLQLGLPGDAKPLSGDLLKVISFNQSSKDIRDFARKLEQISTLRIDIAPDAVSQSYIGTGAPIEMAEAPTASSAKAPKGPLPKLPLGSSLIAATTTPTADPVDTSWRISYEGPIHGLLDKVTRKFDLGWEQVDDRIVIRRIVSRTFRLVALAGITSGSSTISSKQDSGGSSGSSGGAGAGKSLTSGQTATVSFEGLSPWSAVQDVVGLMLTKEGKLTVSPALGTITVVDRMSAIERVADFVRSTNSAMSKQVVLNVKVYSVTLKDADQYGIDWGAAFNDFNSLGLSLQSASGAADSTGSFLGFKVLSQIGSSGTVSQFAGSSVILNALSSQGRVSEQIGTTLVTLNNQPVPLQVVRQQSYLASSSVTVTPNVGTTTELLAGQVNAGIDMSFVPHVLDDGRILLQYSMSLSDIASIDKVSSGQASIQLPNVNVRSFIQRISVRSGETLVMSGFEQNSLSTAQQGVGSVDNLALGGAQGNTQGRNVIVLVVQPTLL